MSSTLGARQTAQFPMKKGDFVEISGSGEVRVNFTGQQKTVRILATSQQIGPFLMDGDCTIVAGLTPSVFTVSRERETAGDLPVTYNPETGRLIAGGEELAGADGSVTIVNNLTSGGAAAALSAQQGVVLKGITDGLGGEVDSLAADLDAIGAPAAFTSRALIDADNGKSLILASAQTATVNNGLPTGFGCAFKGDVSFAGSATVNDVRVAGAAAPWCALMQTTANTYDAVGGKA